MSKIKSILAEWGVPSEVPGDGSYRLFDLSGTSPPFFNRETYTPEAALISVQSSTKFPAYVQWKKNFLRPLVTRQMALSKVCWIHIKPVWDRKEKTTHNLAGDVRTIVKENGGVLLGDLAIASTTRKGCSQKHEATVEFKAALAELNSTPHNMGSQGRTLTRKRPIECDPVIFFCHKAAIEHLKVNMKEELRIASPTRESLRQ